MVYPAFLPFSFFEWINSFDYVWIIKKKYAAWIKVVDDDRDDQNVCETHISLWNRIIISLSFIEFLDNFDKMI